MKLPTTIKNANISFSTTVSDSMVSVYLMIPVRYNQEYYQHVRESGSFVSFFEFLFIGLDLNFLTATNLVPYLKQHYS